MRVLVVEDEAKVAEFIRKGLEQNAYTVDWARTGPDGLDMALGSNYDLILLDLMLPGLDGLSVVREIRAGGISTPVLALTARGGVDDRIAGLDSGCDDYLPKPFAFAELLARVRALVRRHSAQVLPKMAYLDLEMDPAARIVTRAGKRIELTNKEYALLEMLLRHTGQVLTRNQLMESVWGYDFDNSSNVLEVYMNFLRKKIDRNFEPKILHTVRGVGYVLRNDDL
jgi:DNA-binding response OmpR family regulator